MERKQFTWYRSYYEALRTLPPEDFKAAVLAVCAYALDGDLPSLSGVPSAIFTLIRPTLDSGRNKAENRLNKSEQTEIKPQQTKNKSEQTDNKPKTNQQQTNNKPEQTGNEKEKEKEEEREKESESENDSYYSPPTPSQPKRFVPPTLAEVQSYVAERHSAVDPQAFIDFYASKGWMVGKTPMKDWKAACRNAEKWDRWAQRAPTSSAKQVQPSGGTSWMKDYLTGGNAP